MLLNLYGREGLYVTLCLIFLFISNSNIFQDLVPRKYLYITLQKMMPILKGVIFMDIINFTMRTFLLMASRTTHQCLQMGYMQYGTLTMDIG